MLPQIYARSGIDTYVFDQIAAEFTPIPVTLVETGPVCATLRDVPNLPLMFAMVATNAL